MEILRIEDLNFTYPNKKEPALSDINFTVKSGQFVLICGQTGCGKSTLLKNLKTVLTPHGTIEGNVLFYNKPIQSISHREQASRIGFVMQNPDNQIVTDVVWHELAFGLESLGYDTGTIRLRVAEMASYFGIQNWFLRDVSTLSGGEKQLLNLASVLTMQPDLLILDEPTSQLDPIAASDFISTIRKINQEIGTTVIMTGHRLEELIPMSDKMMLLDNGRIVVNKKPMDAVCELFKNKHPMRTAMPVPVQVYGNIVGKEPSEAYPLTVKDGKAFLSRLFDGEEIKKKNIKKEEQKLKGGPVIQLKNVWFRYDRDARDIIKDLSMEVRKGQFFCIVGGNGSGKTTTLKLIGGLCRQHRGKVIVNKKKIGILPQDPCSLFTGKTVAFELEEILEQRINERTKKDKRIKEISRMVEIDHLLQMHPYDLSGGEQQRVALAKILLLEPEILLLDEPTKGLDNFFKEKLADILKGLTEKGITVVLVSHDIEFCAQHSDKCAMLFNGTIMSVDTPRRFFSGNNFYTTAANRMTRHIYEEAITLRDVIELCREKCLEWEMPSRE